LKATTGIASVNGGGKTIHKWSGIGNERFSSTALLEVKVTVIPNKQLGRRVLIIDEILMLRVLKRLGFTPPFVRRAC
jgi:hypothetical protein